MAAVYAVYMAELCLLWLHRGVLFLETLPALCACASARPFPIFTELFLFCFAQFFTASFFLLTFCVTARGGRRVFFCGTCLQENRPPSSRTQTHTRTHLHTNTPSSGESALGVCWCVVFRFVFATGQFFGRFIRASIDSNGKGWPFFQKNRNKMTADKTKWPG